jgi:hypothetical protein
MLLYGQTDHKTYTILQIRFTEALILMQEKDDFSFTENGLGCDFFPLGACI